MRLRGAQTLLVWTAALAVCLAAPARRQDPPRPETVVLGPARDVATLIRFGDEPLDALTPAAGPNAAYTLSPARRMPGLPEPVLAARVWRKDPNDREGSHTWFSLTQTRLPPVTLPSDTDGFRIVLGFAEEAQWWISLTLTTDTGEIFTMVLTDAPFPTGQPVQWLVPFDRFRNAQNEPLTLAKARTLRTLTFATSSPGTTLLFDRITAYRQERLRGWLDFTTSHPTNNLFQRTDPVSLAFQVGGTLPEGASGFRYEVRDFYGQVAAHGSARLSGAAHYTFPDVRYAPGYYEVCAYWTDVGGRDLTPFSCLCAEGTVPDRLGTFAVLPHTLAENRARSLRIGYNSFFGLHGDFLGLADYVGLTWRFDYTAWTYQEPSKPDRSSGTAPWAQEALKQPPQPAYRFHIQPFTLNESVPSWARDGSGKAPGFAWDDALAMVRDTVKVEKRLYPHRPHRFYGGLWEVDLNDPLYGSQKPVYAPEDITEVYRRLRPVVKQEDPSGQLIGPCASVIRPDWFEAVFKTGVLDYVDGIETHAYTGGTFTPEADDLPGRIHRLNALIRQYHEGKALPIYVTEAGQPGIVGSDVVYRSQAARMVRACILLKGEGVRVFLPFYGIDYERAGYWGFLFNLDVDSPSGPWSTQRTCPKPMVNAVAACVDILEGTVPAGRLHTTDPGVWAYAFRHGNTLITAVWSPTGRRTVNLPTRGSVVEVEDMMDRATRFTAGHSSLRLTVSEAPVYVVTRFPATLKHTERPRRFRKAA